MSRPIPFFHPMEVVKMPTQIKQLKEKQDELTSVRDKLKKAFEEGKVGTGPKTELDVDKITVLYW